MENKDIFLKQIASFQNFRSMLKTRNTLLEKALGEDTTVMDFRGIDEFENCLADLLYVMFTPFDNKRYVCDGNIKTYAWGHVNIPENENQKFSM